MRLLVVSNRLPVTAVKENGKLTFKESVGGLVTGLSAYLDSLRGAAPADGGYEWVGWPGIAVTGKARAEVQERLVEQFNAYPVFISEQAMDKFYHGFCNRTVWPLFHYFPSYTRYPDDYWRQYIQVNRAFRDAVMEVVEPDDLVWVHDYHLMLLPGLLRERMPAAKIGFFLHIPFPTYEVFRLLPKDWRAEILRGLLGADLIGFHTEDYTRYFLRCVIRILGLESDLKGRIIADGRTTRAEVFPMGIDFARFNSAVSTPEVRDQSQDMRRTLSPCKVVLSIDRLDYTKGIFNRLRAYAAFLEKYPEWRGKAVLVLVVVPSRVGVEEYRRTKRQVDELVGSINGTYGSIDWTPIRYQYTFLPFEELVGLYAASDVALVTPLRDGMNLIAKEYVASRAAGTGVLILSETAGASIELREALIVNPNDIGDIADTLKNALEMDEEEQVRRNELMRGRLARYNVTRWAGSFIEASLATKHEQALPPAL